MRNNLVSAAILLATCALFTASAGAATRATGQTTRRTPEQFTGEGTIGGQVLETNGKAVAGARVTLEASDGRKPKTTETNAQGRFWFPSLATGLYDVRAYSKGRISDWRKNVWVERGKQSNVTLRLRSGKTTSSKNPSAASKNPPTEATAKP